MKYSTMVNFSGAGAGALAVMLTSFSVNTQALLLKDDRVEAVDSENQGSIVLTFGSNNLLEAEVTWDASRLLWDATSIALGKVTPRLSNKRLLK